MFVQFVSGVDAYLKTNFKHYLTKRRPRQSFHLWRHDLLKLFVINFLVALLVRFLYVLCASLSQRHQAFHGRLLEVYFARLTDGRQSYSRIMTSTLNLAFITVRIVQLLGVLAAA